MSRGREQAARLDLLDLGQDLVVAHLVDGQDGPDRPGQVVQLADPGHGDGPAGHTRSVEQYELNSQSVVESKIPPADVWNRSLLLLALFPAQSALFFVLVLFYHLPCCTSPTCTLLFVFVCLALSLLRIVAFV